MVKANVREFVRIIVAVLVIGVVVGPLLSSFWDVRYQEPCTFSHDKEIVIGYDDSHLHIFLIRKPEKLVPDFYDVAEYTRLGETQDRALWKFASCWRLPSAAVRSLVTYEHWQSF